MISEKWDLKLDIEKLQIHLREHVFSKEITRQSEAFGGWSVLSSNGDHRDGWGYGHLLHRPDVSDEIKQKIRDNFRPTREHTLETELCSGYLKEVVDTLRSHDLSPCRTRIICLSAGMECVWHRDADEKQYAVRLHIPIFTNEGCFFETETEREHFAADGSAYFIYVNRIHRVVNHGTTDRFHLVTDVTDIKGVTRFHRLADFAEPRG